MKNGVPKLLVPSRFVSWYENVETAVLCPVEQLCHMVGRVPGVCCARHPVLLFPGHFSRAPPLGHSCAQGCETVTSLTRRAALLEYFLRFYTISVFMIFLTVTH